MTTNKTSINPETKKEDIIYSNFNELNKENQKLLIKSYTDDKSKGWFDKIFEKKKVTTYISLVICICLLLVGIIITCVELYVGNKLNYTIWEKIFPVITLALGYIFGKNPPTVG